MATYLPGITDYIPQFQPFQPDYNFLGNMLQNAQSKYDSGYKQLSKTYGTLLNSPMLREDNIQQRDDFFKMIDGDIKRISGMDLSLQQNVDSANAVFDSFYQNKEMVKDMTYTKEYQRQLEVGENYRNCIDQDKCGGKYWDVGAQAMHYRADEFKKANRKDTLTMSPGRFVPQINIQEKAMNYAKDLLGKNGTFGITSVNWSPDGRYIVTTKNGSSLEIPLQQLLINQYGRDQNIIDMYNTQQYVSRKGFIASNAERFGSEDAAEDAYFSTIDSQLQIAQQALKDANDLKNNSTAKKTKLEAEIKKRGSTGGDDLAFDYVAAGTDAASATENVAVHEETVKVANSIFEAGDNRQMKRQRVDGFLSRMLMNKEIGDSATAIAAMTGETTVEEDPYAKSYYDFSLDMSKLKQTHEYTKDEELYKTMLDLSKQQALMEYKNRGSAAGGSNVGRFKEAIPGTTDVTLPEDLNINQEDREDIVDLTNTVQSNADKYTSGLALTYMTVIDSKSSSVEDKVLARNSMIRLYGQVKRDEKGNVVSPGYNAKTNKFVGMEGEEISDPQEATKLYATKGAGGWRELYKRSQYLAKADRSFDFVKEYVESDKAQAAVQGFDENTKLLSVSSKVWRENNKNIKKLGGVSLGGATLESKNSEWGNFFTEDGGIKTKEQYIKWYTENIESDALHAQRLKKSDEAVASMGGMLPMSIMEGESASSNADATYDSMYAKYTKLYNSSPSANGVNLVKSMHSINDFGYKAGGKSAGGGVEFDWKADEPGSLGTSGLITFANDINQESYFTIGNVGTQAEAQLMNNANAKTAYQQLISDYKAGKLTKKEETEAGLVTYMDTALGDKDKIGLLVTFPESWLNQYKGTKTETTWADEVGLSSGVGIYTDKAGANNAFTTAYQTQPYDMILNHSAQVIEKPDGGKITINKRASNGSFTVEGQMKTYTTDAKGKVVEGDPITMSTIYPAGTSGQNIYVGLNAWLQEAANANTVYKQSMGKQDLHFDPSTLPQIQTMLNTQAGDAAPQQDLSTMFLQNVQFNNQMMQQQH